jgi:hypothetical protein
MNDDSNSRDDERISVDPTGPACTSTRACIAQAYPGRDARSLATVRVNDRPSPDTISVSWSQPNSCRYGDQMWFVSVARRRGACALSGAAVEPGDWVYRPRGAKRRPLNADAVMLVSAVAELLDTD